MKVKISNLCFSEIIIKKPDGTVEKLPNSIAGAVTRLMGFDMPSRQYLKLTSIANDLNKECEPAIKTQKMLLDKYVEKDELGNLAFTDETKEKFKFIDEEAFNKEGDELLNSEVELNTAKLTCEDIDLIKIPRNEFYLLSILYGKIIEE